MQTLNGRPAVAPDRSGEIVSPPRPASSALCRPPAARQHKAQQGRPARLVAAQAQTSAPPASPSTSNGAKAEGGPEDTYELYLTKPLGIRFARGNDGGIYVARSDSSLGSTDPRVKPGDKIKLVSASFGDDVWEAENFGQVMYAIKTRNGEVYLKMQDKKGDMAVFEETEESIAEKRWKQERRGGNYGAGTKERQAANYLARQEVEKRRRRLFEDSLAQFKKEDVKSALEGFEEVIALEPRKYLGDDFSRHTQVFRAAQYNLACCYASIGQVDAGLEAIDQAMASGFEQFGQIRADPNLEPLRRSPKFKAIIEKYDEPIINASAMKAIKSIFSWGKKDDE